MSCAMIIFLNLLSNDFSLYNDSIIRFLTCLLPSWIRIGLGGPLSVIRPRRCTLLMSCSSTPTSKAVRKCSQNLLSSYFLKSRSISRLSGTLYKIILLRLVSMFSCSALSALTSENSFINSFLRVSSRLTCTFYFTCCFIISLKSHRLFS